MFLRRYFHFLLAVLCISCLCPALLAQPQGTQFAPEEPFVNLFGGYSQYHAGGTVNGIAVPNFTGGFGAQATVMASEHLGVTVDYNYHSNSTATATNFAVGPQVRYRWGRLMPFWEFMVGAQAFNPKHYPSQTVAQYVLGGGVDVRVNSHFAVRPIQFDYVNTYYTAYSPSNTTNTFNGYRIQSGVVYTFNRPALEVARAACGATPETVDAGVPVKIEVVSIGFPRKYPLHYSYASSGGGKVEGTTDHATVDTTGMTEGEYVVNATVDNNAKGKTRQSASCEAKFTVHTPSPTTSASSAPASTAPASVPTPQPPSLTIAATPEKLFVGDPASITAEGKSPAGYPLTYKCTTSAGHLTGDAPKYTLQTAGATPGTIQVDCTVSDDHSQRTTASASIEVRPHETARIPHKFATISFAHDAKRPSRVDNVAKAILDRYTDALAAAPDTKGVLVGYQTDAEAAIAKQHDGAADPGALRAANTKNYLSTEKGVDAARIELRSGGGKRPSVELWIVPRGEQFVQTHTTVVDESKIQPVPREALRPRKAAKAAPTKK